MANTITIDQAGRIVIPKAVRERHRLTAGTDLSLTEENGRIVLTPATDTPRLVERGGLLILALGHEVADGADHRTARQDRISTHVDYALER